MKMKKNSKNEKQKKESSIKEQDKEQVICKK
jgi:hypothetical protein